VEKINSPFREEGSRKKIKMQEAACAEKNL
jgi:hypothetical protein